jgi:hypothetical protein
MRSAIAVFAFFASTGAALATTQAAEACKEALSPVGQQIYAEAITQKPTPATARGIITKEVESLIANGTLSMSDGRKEGMAVGECLKKLE